jgi:lysosomal acid phosphatase
VQVQAYLLGSILRKEYFDESSPNYIHNVRTDLVNLDQVHARIKNGGEGRVVFDSTIALLQGLFPPTQSNTIVLANDTAVTAPLGGYQYVPGECCIYDMYRVVSLTLLQLRLSSLPMIARSRAGRTAQ